MAGSMNYYPFHIGDYAAHTQRLSLMEDLAYRRLIDAYYLAERPLSGSPSDIARDIGMMEQLESVKYVLSKFFEAKDGEFSNARCDKEIAHFNDKKLKASNAGKTSAQRRLNKKSTDVEKVATDVQPTNNQEPITNNQEPINKSSCSSESSREFDDDDAPKDPATWAEVFANDHGIDIDHRSAQSRAKFWPLAKGWVQAGVTVGQMRRACAKARAEATEPIAWLPAYADRVLASMQAPQRQPKQAAEPEWRTEQRNRTLQAVPGIAARTQTPTNIIDVKATNVPAIALD